MMNVSIPAYGNRGSGFNLTRDSRKLHCNIFKSSENVMIVKENKVRIGSYRRVKPDPG